MESWPYYVGFLVVMFLSYYIGNGDVFSGLLILFFGGVVVLSIGIGIGDKIIERREKKKLN